ncbi:MAG: hypothetical protein K6G84_13875 [Lachnospiraceae bacterium]|nr:hypothetical protein [Lachnospiraceae bacterium]
MKRRSIGFLAIITAMMLGTTGCAALGSISHLSEAIEDNSRKDGGVTEEKKESKDKDDDSEKESKSKKSHKNSGEAKETLMVYMVGSNLESEIGAATTDLQEMALSGYDADDMNVVVCAGGASKWWNTSVGDDGLSMYIMEDKDIIPVYDMKNENMAEPETLKEFINEAKEEYPAENYSLILWNHGGGAVIGYGADEKYGNAMLSVSQLGEAISGSDVCSDGKFEWIGFDACMMGMIEVADTLKDSANYMIASEEVEAQDGWNYSVLGDITKNGAYSGEEAGELITKAFAKFYDDTYYYVPDYTLSCIDMSKVGDVTDAIADFAKKADGSLVKGAYSKIARARDNTKSFGNMGNASLYDYVDLGCFSREIAKVFPDEAKNLEDAIRNCVVHNMTNVSRASGLSVYFPYENLDAMDKMVKIYDKEKYNSDYISFIHDFKDTMHGKDLAEWTVAKDDPVAETSSNTGYSIQLSEGETENFSKAYSSIWEKNTGDESGESYIFWLDSDNTTLDENGKLSTDFDGRIFYLTDDSGDKVPVFAIQTEAADDYSEYVTQVMKGGVFSSDTHNVNIHFRVDKDHPNGVITGVYRAVSGNGLDCPEKKVDTLEDGDPLTILYFARKIKFNDDGSVEPFETWEESSFVGAQMEIEGKLGVSFEKPAKEHDYIGLFSIHDTQGKKHYSNYLDIHVDGEEGNGMSVYDEAFADE